MYLEIKMYRIQVALLSCAVPLQVLWLHNILVLWAFSKIVGLSVMVIVML